MSADRATRADVAGNRRDGKTVVIRSVIAGGEIPGEALNYKSTTSGTARACNRHHRQGTPGTSMPARKPPGLLPPRVEAIAEYQTRRAERTGVALLEPCLETANLPMSVHSVTLTALAADTGVLPVYSDASSVRKVRFILVGERHHHHTTVPDRGVSPGKSRSASHRWRCRSDRSSQRNCLLAGLVHVGAALAPATTAEVQDLTSPRTSRSIKRQIPAIVHRR